MTPSQWVSRLARLGVPTLAFLLGACGGDNQFRNPAGIIGSDRELPSVRVEAPDSGQRVAVGDSVLVTVDLRDDAGIETVELTGFSMRGSASLGTQVRVERFEPKVVDLGALDALVADTTFSRHLLATGDTIVEDSVYIVARVTDFAGNTVADTVEIAIGGPRVQIVSPSTGGEVRADSDLRVTLSASDASNRLQSLRLQARGGLSTDVLLTFEQPLAAVDTVLEIPIPADATSGEVELRAIARNTVNDSTISAAVRLDLLPPQADDVGPLVRFRVDAPGRAERTDSVAVTVIGRDETRLDSIGVTIRPIHRLSTSTDTLTIYTDSEPRDSTTFRVPLTALGVPAMGDTSTVRLEVTAFAYDAAGNCSTATLVNTELSEACPERDPVFGIRAGARYEVLVVRGQTLRVGASGDVIADMTANATHLYLSNLSRNRVEVLPIGGTQVTGSIGVGSRPWGLAFNAARSRLYVANSGGTNISVVSPTLNSEVERIQTPNVKLYDVPFIAVRVPDPDGEATDSVTGYFPSSVTRRDYSDRPQFIGVTQNENVIYSTQPTAAAADGTVRILRRDLDRLEIVTDYAEERVGLRVVIANADSAFLVAGSPNNLILVCPRNRSENPALDRRLPERCFGPDAINEVQEEIAAAGYDTRFLYSVDIDEVGLSDTTFVAVSRDHSAIAFGEGGEQNARVMLFEEPAGQSNGPLLKYGEIRDLVGNTAERVFALALNSDGSLGMARGAEAYLFSDTLRLQGVIQTEQGTGGVDMHPDNPGQPLAFISGVEENGLAFIDVVDTFHFSRVARIFLRDRVIGPLRVVRAPGSGGLKIYAVTEGGLVALDL